MTRALPWLLLCAGLGLVAPGVAHADGDLPMVQGAASVLNGEIQFAPALKILVLLSILSIAPAILVSITSFTRIIVVLSFVRQAAGTANVPPTQVLLVLSLLLTAVVMAPVAARVQTEVLVPYDAEQISDKEAFRRTCDVFSVFLLKHTRQSDLLLMYESTRSPLPADPGDVAFHLLVPAFMLSELRTGFEMGFLLFLPFLLVDLVVSSVLTSMGMVMMPPTVVSTPLKLLLFVLVDGWSLVVRSLLGSFA